jgi:hypothetical protein
LVWVHLPAGFVDGACDRCGALPAQRHAEDHLDQRAARGIDVQSLLDGAAGVDLDDPHVAVGLGSRVVAAFHRPSSSSCAGEAFATGVLVVALARDDRVQQVPKRLGILHCPHPDIVLQRPQRNLDRVAGRLSITAGETITVLRPQLGGGVARELLGMPHRVCKPRATTADKCRERLVGVLTDDHAAPCALDCLTALA